MKSNKIRDHSKLTKRQCQALPHILSSPTYEEAARRAQVSSKQIHEWLKDPVFREELKKQRDSVFCDALSYLKSRTQKAVQTIVALLEDEDPRIRLSASEKILATVFKATEFLDFEERISVLEKLAEKASHEKGGR